MFRRFATATAVTIATACASGEAATDRWQGTIDTLASGQIVVHNPATPIWTEETRWTVEEDLRIGSVDSDGPELFGRIMDLEVDDEGRIYVLESQSNELRIFDANGRHLTTSGRKGGGPGEFAQPLMLAWGPDGNLWIVDPPNNRISVFDHSGQFVTSHRQPGGFVIMPWPGRFDRAGSYYSPVPLQGQGDFRMGLVLYDSAFTPGDTLQPPDDPVKREYFELHSDGGHIMAGIPYSAGFRWRLSSRGTILAALTGEYRFIEFTATGDTLRTITRAFDPLPVTGEDRDSAVADMEWFTRQGGQIDMSKLPDHKPAVSSFFWDDEDNLWVIPVTERGRERRVAQVFDPDGRYLGEVTFPFELRSSPYPTFRDGVMYAVTTDELEVPFVVRARIVKPGAGAEIARGSGS